MNIENVSQYVSSNLNFILDETHHKRNVLGLVLLTALLGIAPGAILRSYWGYMTLVMCLITLACVVMVFACCWHGLTLKLGLWVNVVVCAGWVIDISIVELMYFTMWKGFSPQFLLIYLPIILFPLFFGLKTHKALKKTDYKIQEASKGNFKISFVLAGVTSSIARLCFRNVDQGTAIMIMLFCFSVANAFLSVGLLSLLKLYYIKKYNISL